MGQIPSGSNECCLPGVEGLTYLKVSVRGVTRGVMGLDKVVQQLLMMGRRLEEVTDTELAGMAWKLNYIPDQETVEADNAIALRQAYATFNARQEQKK